MNVTFEASDNIHKLIFPESFDDEILDIDHIFKLTNDRFVDVLDGLNLKADFDFSNRDNKKLYTHSFILTLMEYLKNREEKTKLYFYSNTLTKDPFRNRLIKKIKTIFGFTIYEDVIALEDLLHYLQIGHSGHCTKIRAFLDTDRKPKSFKHIKKYMDQLDLSYLSDQYFQDINNKLRLCV